MRIAVVTTSYPAFEGDPSGHFVEAEVHALEREGHSVEVFRPRSGGAFGWPGAPARMREKPSRLLEASVWAMRTTFALRRSAPDHIVAHWCVPAAFPIVTQYGAPPGANRPSLEVVSHGGDVRLLVELPASAREAVVAKVTERAAAWRFVSEELRQALLGAVTPELRRRIDRIATILPGALEMPDVRLDVEAKRATLGGRRLYVCAGRLVSSKRVDKVIDYVATTSHAQGRAERVLVVVGDGPERTHLERQARAWQMDVRFLGVMSRRETLGWIGAADELVHASRVEGLSTVIREASLLGVEVTLLG